VVYTVISEVKRLRQEDLKFPASLGYIVTVNNNNKNKKESN
jgi:hypothetical protein